MCSFDSYVEIYCCTEYITLKQAEKVCLLSSLLTVIAELLETLYGPIVFRFRATEFNSNDHCRLVEGLNL